MDSRTRCPSPSGLRFFVEQAGAEFVGVSDGSVLFRDPHTGEVSSLYVSGLRGAEDVAAALRRCRERRLEEQLKSQLPVTLP
jgi:hypothetical protein